MPRLESYISINHINGKMHDLEILPADVRKLLLELNINKAMGPDKIHPKLLKFLAENDNFIKSLTTLFNACIINEEIPLISIVCTQFKFKYIKEFPKLICADRQTDTQKLLESTLRLYRFVRFFSCTYDRN